MAYVYFEESLATEAANALGAISVYNFESKEHDLVCSFCKTTLARISKSKDLWKATWELNPCFPRSKFVIQLNPTWKIIPSSSAPTRALLQVQSPVQREPQAIIDLRDYLLSQEVRIRQAGKPNCCAKREELRASCPTDQLFIVEAILEERESPEGVFYKVRWAGFSSEHDSWEPAENLADCKDVLQVWQTSHTAAQHLFGVEEILAKRVSSQGTFYRVRWAGFSSDQDSWEPVESLVDCAEALQSWNQAHKAIRSGPAL